MKIDMKKFGWMKVALFGLLGGLAPIIPVLTLDMSWSDLTAPFYLLAVIYEGGLVVVAYLFQSPIPSKHVVDPTPDYPEDSK